MKSSRSANLSGEASEQKNKASLSRNRQMPSKSEKENENEKPHKYQQHKLSLLKVASLFTMSLKLSKSKSCGEGLHHKQNQQWDSPKIHLNNVNTLNGASNDEENVFDEELTTPKISSSEHTSKEKNSSLLRTSLMKPFFGMISNKNSKRAISSRDIKELETQIADHKGNYASSQRRRNPSLAIYNTGTNLKAPLSASSLLSCKLAFGDGDTLGLSTLTRSTLNSNSANYLRVPSNSSFTASSNPSSRRSSDLANYSRLCSTTHSDDKADPYMFISSKSSSMSNMSEAFDSQPISSASSSDSFNNSLKVSGSGVPIIRVQSYDEAKHYKIKREEQRISERKYEKLRINQRKQTKSANLNDSRRAISDEYKRSHHQRHRENQHQICGRLEINSKSATNFVSRLNDVCIAFVINL
jgi:hypothetical protein